MESMSDVLKNLADLSFLKKTEDKSRAIMSDPFINKLKNKYPELDESAMKLNMNKLYQYVTEMGHCTYCPGLDLCPNDFTGHYTRITVEKINDITYVLDHKVTCKKLLARKTEEAVRNRIRSFYVDERALKEGYNIREIENLDPERKSAVRQILKYIVSTKKNGLQKNGLYLVGEFGTGKTFLMSYMLHELAKVGLSGVIIYMPDFIEDLKSMFQEPQKLKEMIDIMKETDLLIFDDIGAENLNPWARDHIIGSILNHRMNRKPTFYTSNYELDALQEHFSFTNKDGDEEYKGQRIMDRIRPFVDVIVVSGDNKRGRQ
ncbi:MAG TPA: primosomal protein DnaI [Bacilli bacterium]